MHTYSVSSCATHHPASLLQHVPCPKLRRCNRSPLNAPSTIYYIQLYCCSMLLHIITQRLTVPSSAIHCRAPPLQHVVADHRSMHHPSSILSNSAIANICCTMQITAQCHPPSTIQLHCCNMLLQITTQYPAVPLSSIHCPTPLLQHDVADHCLMHHPPSTIQLHCCNTSTA